MDTKIQKSMLRNLKLDTEWTFSSSKALHEGTPGNLKQQK